LKELTENKVVFERITNNTMILYTKMLLTVVLSLYTTRKTLEVLGISDFGIFTIIGGIITLLSFFNASLTTASQRFMSYAQGESTISEQAKIFNISYLMHVVIGIVLLLLLEIVGKYLINKQLSYPRIRTHAVNVVFQCSLITMLFSVLSVPYEALLNAHENMFFFAITGVIESVLKLIFIILISKMQNIDKLIVYSYSLPIIFGMLYGLKWWYCEKHYKESKIRIKQNFDRQKFKAMFSFAGWSFLGTSTSMIANYGQGLVLNVFFGTVVNAAQSITAQLSGQLGAFASTMQKALNPAIDKSEGAGNRSMMLTTSLLGCRISFFLLSIFYIPLFYKLENLLKLWLVDIPAYTVIFCKLLFIRNLIEQLYISLINAIGAVGNIRKFQIVVSIINFLPLLFAYILFKMGLPPYSLYIVFIIYAIIQGIVIVYFNKSICHLNIKTYWKEVISPSLLPFSIALIVSYILSKCFTSNKTLIIYLILAFLATIECIWIWGIHHQQKTYIKNMLFNFLSKKKLVKNGMEEL
jgi:O-antigen/teichoic acid export membrane protein